MIGKSGSGKSTLGQLLTRLYSPSSGRIVVDGLPIQDYDINWIRNNTTLVEQNSVLFSESIFTNIAFGRYDYQNVTEAEVNECVDAMMLRSVVDGLPDGIHTFTGPGGGFLSGGQRQRVAMARARLRDTPILILDEPTSALDIVNRTAIMRAVRKWRTGKTTIIITHDTASIQDEDFLYVMEKGAVTYAGYRHEIDDEPELANYFYNNGTDSSNDDDLTDTAAAHLDDHLRAVMSRVDSWRRSFRRSRQPPPSVNSESTVIEMSPVSPICELDEKKKQVSFVQHKHSSSTTITPIMHLDMLPEDPANDKKKKGNDDDDYPPLSKIILTIVPSLRSSQRFLLAFGLLSTILHASVTPVFSYCMSQLFTTFFTIDSTRAAMKWSLAIIGLAVADSTLDGAMHCALEYSGQSWVDALRNTAMRRVLDQPRVWFEKVENQAGKMTTSLVQNGEDTRSILGKHVGYTLIAVTVTIIAVAWSLVLCWRLTLVALSCCPVVYAVTKALQVVTARWEKRYSEATDAASAVFSDMFSEIGTVRTLTLGAYFHRRHITASARCLTVGIQRAGYTSIVFGAVESMILFATALVNYYPAQLITSKIATVDNVIAVESLLLFSVGYVGTVLSWIPQASASRSAAAELLRLANLPEGISYEHAGQVKAFSSVVPVEFKQVNFRYPSRPDVLALRDVTTTIRGNACTAIVGRSGSGKSTMASLLLGLYEAPPGGGISLGGIDIASMHMATLRSVISMVPQQAHLFPDTIAANIAYGLDASNDEIEQAAQAAGIHEFINSLPSGYLTLIGDGGMGLSGGQAQRIMIARALIRQPAILILDEATSALDGESSLVVRQTVKKLVDERRNNLTVIIITHAREMMEMAEWVVVMEQGAVVEEGRYWELADRRRGKLRMLLESKEAGLDNDDDETTVY